MTGVQTCALTISASSKARDIYFSSVFIIKNPEGLSSGSFTYTSLCLLPSSLLLSALEFSDHVMADHQISPLTNSNRVSRLAGCYRRWGIPPRPEDLTLFIIILFYLFELSFSFFSACSFAASFFAFSFSALIRALSSFLFLSSAALF